MTANNNDQIILMVDDDITFTKLVKKYLGDAGLNIVVHHSGRSAIDYVQTGNCPALIILDLMMPDIDGLETCKEIRKIYSGPIMMLTALNEEVDEVVGLEVGADDYLGKPLKPRVLLARIRALLRRASGTSHNDGDVVEVGDLLIDSSKHNVHLGNTTLDVTDAEFDLLHYLGRHAGSIVSREELYSELMHLNYDGMDRTIDLRVSRLRKKLATCGRETVQIKTIRSKGYLLVTNS